MSDRQLLPRWWFSAAWSVAAALGLLALSVSGCGHADANNPGSTKLTASDDAVPRVQTVTVKQQDLARKIEMPGTVEGYETADLYAKVGGFLQEVSVDIGDRVEKDQVLARLWIPEMHKELEEKEAAVGSAIASSEQVGAARDEASTELHEKQYQLEYRGAEYDRIEALVESGSLNKKLLDEVTYQRKAAQAAVNTVEARIRTAEAALKSAKAQVELAKAQRGKIQTMLQYGEIRAPFDGVVTKRYFHRGAFIQSAEGNSAAKPLLTVTRTDVVRIFLDLPMAEVRWLNRGDKAVLDRINVLPGERFEGGEVTRFASSLDRTSRMMRVEIDLENPGHRLLPGYYGYVALVLDEFPQTPVIPSSALMTEGNEMFVYCVEGGVCRKQTVTTNYQDGTIVGISSGLHGGEHVVQAGAGQLAEGQKVIAVNANSDT